MKCKKRFARLKPILLQAAATALTGCLLLAAPAQASQPFTDVPADHWAASAVEELRSLGFSDGIGNNQFGLGQTITRAQFAAFIAKIEGYNGSYPQAYTDNTDANAWYYGTLNAIAANQVTSQTGAFRPDDPITRAEMTEMMIGALGFYELGNQLSNRRLSLHRRIHTERLHHPGQRFGTGRRYGRCQLCARCYGHQRTGCRHAGAALSYQGKTAGSAARLLCHFLCLTEQLSLSAGQHWLWLGPTAHRR